MAKEVREIVAVGLRRDELDIKGLAKLLLDQVRAEQGAAAAQLPSKARSGAAS